MEYDHGGVHEFQVGGNTPPCCYPRLPISRNSTSFDIPEVDDIGAQSSSSPELSEPSPNYTTNNSGIDISSDSPTLLPDIDMLDRTLPMALEHNFSGGYAEPTQYTHFSEASNFDSINRDWGEASAGLGTQYALDTNSDFMNVSSWSQPTLDQTPPEYGRFSYSHQIHEPTYPREYSTNPSATQKYHDPYSVEPDNQNRRLNCPVPECWKSFARQSDLTRHKKEQHTPDQDKHKFFCGCCTPKSVGFDRMHKLKSHKKMHGFKEGSELYECEETSCQGPNGLWKLCFCSEDALLRHKAEQHMDRPSIISHQLPWRDLETATSLPSFNNTKSTDIIVDPKVALPSSSTQNGKRGNQVEERSVPKRHKRDEGPLGIDKAEGYNTSSAMLLGAPGKMDISARNMDGGDSQHELVLSNICSYDVIKLLRSHWIIQFVNGLQQDLKSPITFNPVQQAIKLTGHHADSLKRLKDSIESHLASRFHESNTYAKNSNLLDAKSRLKTSCRTISTAAEFYPLRPVEDSAIVEFWHSKIIPKLPPILKNLIGPDYTASLVRKAAPNGRLYIHIQSYKKLDKNTEELIRKDIQSFLYEDKVMPLTKIKFVNGRLRNLAGGAETEEVDEDVDSEDESTEAPMYPFYQRYWGRPGPGASIGLTCTDQVSATLGCYVEVDGLLFLLTVKHFIETSRQRVLRGTTDDVTLMSPAMLDVLELREDLDRNLRDYKTELDSELKKLYGNTDVSLGDLDKDLPEELEQISRAVVMITKDLSHIAGDRDTFKLGTVVHQSEPSSQQVTKSAPEQAFHHHLDWALCSVVDSRKGTNRHRYKHDAGEAGFFDQNADKCGAGDPIIETDVIRAGDEVHFVGQSTGRISGTINPARMLSSQGNVVGEEWTIFVPRQDPKKKASEVYKGASGATVIRSSDNKLLGLLWACNDGNGLLTFTPINVVFDDIKRVAQATKVELPIVAPLSPSPSTPALTVNDNQLTPICRDAATEKGTRKKPRRYTMPKILVPTKVPPRQSEKPEQVPNEKPASTGKPIIMEKPAQTERTPPTSNQITKPTSSITTILNPKSSITPRFTLEPHQLKSVLQNPEDKKFKYSFQYILSGYTHLLDSQRRSTLPPRFNGGKSVRRTGTWPKMAVDQKNRYLEKGGRRNALDVICVN